MSGAQPIIQAGRAKARPLIQTLCFKINKGESMPINKSDVVIGGKYRTENNQERIVVGCSADCKVVYASRGGNVQNAFDNREASSLTRFAEACAEKIGQLTADELQEAIEACNAQNAVSGGECCLQKT